MRPKTKRSELPTRAKVRTHINNSFVDFLESLTKDIAKAPGEVSSLWDLWTAPHTSDPYFGLILQWIDVDAKTGVWTFRDEVAACHKILGNHSGVNLGLYCLLLLDRAGVTSKKHSKVCSLVALIPVIVLTDGYVSF